MKQIHQDILVALRSGEYTQCFGQLRQDSCFCAQGVMGDVLVKQGLGTWRGEELVVQQGGWEFCSRSSLPLTVDGTDLVYNRDILVDAKFIPHSLEGLHRQDISQASVSELNDSLQLSLSEIADILEESWTNGAWVLPDSASDTPLEAPSN